MQIVAVSAPALTLKTNCLVLGVWQDRIDTSFLNTLDVSLNGALRQSVDNKAFVGKESETLLFQNGTALPASRILLVGLGPWAEAGIGSLRSGAAEAGRVLHQQRVTEAALTLCELPPASCKPDQVWQALAEGLQLSAYRFDRYLTQKRDELPLPLETVRILVDRESEVDAAVRAIGKAQQICRGVVLARDLVNEPGNVKSPQFLAAQAQALAERHDIACTVLDQEQLGREGFGALLAVAQGSARPPRLIVLEYRGGDPEDKPLVLVGKGVVFDSGGISLKPGEKMDEMKMDMAGAAAVFGAMEAVAGLRLPINLVAIVPAVENLPSATAYRPGDIISSLSGQTIEVLNTDAEGRLILADALAYAGRFEPRAIIDLATLTGACVIALGHEASAVFSNRDELARQLIAAGGKQRRAPLAIAPVGKLQ